MDTNDKKATYKETDAVVAAGSDVTTQAAKKPERERPTARKPLRRRNNTRRTDERRSEFDQKIMGIRRVVRVMGGGRRFSFSVAMALGDKKGRVGVGIGKASDTALAIEKASRDAKKHMVKLRLTDDMSLPHNVEAKYGASVVQIRPAKGRGLVAGASVRTVLELAGVKDVTAKILSRSKNKINNARATMQALAQLNL